MRENAYQAYLKGLIEETFPGAVVIKQDSAHLQGIPDLLVLCGDRWAMLEVKVSERSRIQPNQDYYVELFDSMGYGSFIYPENEEAVLNDLQHIFGARREARHSFR